MSTSGLHWRGSWLLVLGLICAAALLGMTFNVWPGIPVRNNIMELLPALRDDPVQLQALQRSNDFMSRKLMILVGDADASNTAAATRLVTDSLQAEDFFAEPFTGVSSEDARATAAVYYRFRAQLLGEEYRAALQRGEPAALQAMLTRDLYSPLSGINADLLAGDPLLSFYHFLRELPAAQGRMLSVDGALTVTGEDRQYRVLTVDITQDVFDMNFHPRYQSWREKLLAQVHEQYPQTEILLMGAVQHAVWGASSAKREVSTIGNGSLLGVIALILLVFRSARVLGLALLPLGAGVAAGLVCTLWYDGEIHLITLVFGSSVIGVAMDYSLHYLAEHYKTSTAGGGNSQGVAQTRCLQQVLPGITFAMITSVIAYAAIGFAPFPVLRQIAIFSSAGLLMAWFTVVSLYPQLAQPARFANMRWLTCSASIDDNLRALFASRRSRVLLLLLAAAMLPGILSLRANDDVHVLQTPDADISAMENRVQTLTGFRPAGRFFLVEGETEQQVLERCELLGKQLAQQNITHDIITHYLPSQQRQRENFTLLRTLFVVANEGQQAIATQSFSAKWAQTLGLAAPVAERSAAQFAQPPAHWLTAQDLQASPLGASLQRFQLSQTTRGYIAAAFVDATAADAAMQSLAEQQPGVHWMNPVQDVSALFQHFRVQACWMMLCAYTFIALLLLWRYGVHAAWRVLLAPALAAWLTLGLLGYCGVAINLFHVLALLLVLGVGIDYSIFFAESSAHRDSTMLAVLLSTVTTLLSFGLLALSKTAAISGFGVVVSIGMVCALLFSPLAQHHSHCEVKK